MITIFKRELKTNRKSLFFWCLGMLFMVWTGMMKYSGYQSAGDTANKILEQFPKALQKILGFEGFNLNSATGFYGVLFLYLTVMAAIYAVLLGTNIIAKEERDRTVEFLLVKPASRMRVVGSKILSGIVNLVILNLFTFVSSIFIVKSLNKGESADSTIIILMVGLFVLQLIFFSIGTFIAASTNKPKSAGSISGATIMVTFFIYILIGLNENLDILKYLTPFKYFEASKLISNGSFEFMYLSISTVLIFSSLIGAFYFYNKKDLSV